MHRASEYAQKVRKHWELLSSVPGQSAASACTLQVRGMRAKQHNQKRFKEKIEMKKK